MAEIYAREWTSEQQATTRFRLTTALQDFDDNYAKKSILGYIVNMTESSVDGTYNLTLQYRTAENAPWNYLGNINGRTGANHIKTREFRTYLAVPIKNANGFQLRIVGQIRGDIAINDLSIIYRKIRSVTVSTFD